MGDRTILNVFCQEKDKKVFDKVLRSQNTDVYAEGIVCLAVDDADDGGVPELKKLAGKGLSFYGSHGNGGDYGSELFACFRGELVFVDERDDAPICRMFPTGDGHAEAEPSDKCAAEDYYRMFGKVCKAFNPREG
jgi:hypothetical protein